MIKRTVEISQRAVHVTVKDRQLLLLPKDAADLDPLASIPCEDIGMLLIEHPGVTYSHAALTCLVEEGAAVVLCGRDHLPQGLLLPLAEHTETVWRVQDQISVAVPTRKRLWQQIVQAKIRAQAANLPVGSTTRSRLLGLARSVRSGDPENVEAQAARHYWAAWLSEISLPPADAPFRRDVDAGGVNALLNYGYAVIRAAVARALVSAGLVPVLGIHHSNRSNAFCLADDLVEPLRPLVDEAVREIVRSETAEINPRSKQALLAVLTREVCLGDATGPLLVGLHRYVASFVRCLRGESARLELPLAVKDGATGGP